MEARIEKYGVRHWAIYCPKGELLAVTVYKRGARRIAEILQGLPDQFPQKRTAKPSGGISSVL